MYRLITGVNTTSEMVNSASVISWLHANLASLLSHRSLTRILHALPSPNWSQFVLAGHSRGGKVAYGVAAGIVTPLPVSISGLIGFDPVDGTTDSQTPPPIINHQAHSSTLPAPQLVVASGLGPIPRNKLFPPCAPYEYGPFYFYTDSTGPAVYFNVTAYGHVDFYDTWLGPVWTPLFLVSCTNGPSRPPMIVTSAGLALAFMNSVLFNRKADLQQIYNTPSVAPVSLAQPQAYPLPP